MRTLRPCGSSWQRVSRQQRPCGGQACRPELRLRSMGSAPAELRPSIRSRVLTWQASGDYLARNDLRFEGNYIRSCMPSWRQYMFREGMQFTIVGQPVLLDGCLWLWLCDHYHNLTCPTSAPPLPPPPFALHPTPCIPTFPPSSPHPCPHHCSLNMPSSSDTRNPDSTVQSLPLLWRQQVYTVGNTATLHAPLKCTQLHSRVCTIAASWLA